MKIVLVGLSNKIGLLSFDESTNSGKFINDKIISFVHPSYMYVYKRKELNKYITSIVDTIKEYQNNFKK